MNIEHRYYTRYPAQFPVDVIYRGRRFHSVRAHDIGVDGMHVMATGITLPIGTLVELEFHRWGQEWRIPAVVAHLSGGSVGFMFREPQPVLFRNELDALPAISAQRPLISIAGQQVGL